MNSKFKPGDRVQELDGLLEGRFVGYTGKLARFLTEDGFELEVAPETLVLLPEKPGFSVPPGAAAAKESGRRPSPSAKKGKKERFGPAMEVDLHAEKLLPDSRKIPAHELLDLQVETARRQLEFALRKRIQRLVFIHGVGEGVLREELHTLLRRYEGLRYHDADYAAYGLGATEVYIPQESF
ncbi:MAG TPA: Smr/MutS family protein [Robiginitalea sp.]|nr:Smr/MutS family protein [Robiginitalea sp.]